MLRWLCLSFCLVASTAWAQSIDIQTMRALQAAQAAQARGDLSSALNSLNEAGPAKDSYAEVLIWRNMAYLLWQQDKQKQAFDLLQKAYQSTHLNDTERQEDALNLARLAIQTEQPKQALNYLESVPATEETLELSIYAWQMLKRYDKALPLAERYLAQQKTIADQWLNFMVAANVELKRFDAAERWQKRLLARYPTRVQQWVQLAGIQQLADNHVKAFATLRTAYQQGLDFTADDLDRLVILSSAADQPWQGVRLLEALMQEGTLPRTVARQERLAQLQWQAREHSDALAAYQRLAKQSQQAKHWMAVVQLASEQERWEEANQALQAAASAGANRTEVRSWQDWIAASVE